MAATAQLQVKPCCAALTHLDGKPTVDGIAGSGSLAGRGSGAASAARQGVVMFRAICIALIAAGSLAVSASAESFLRIQNRWTSEYLNTEQGILATSRIQPGWHSAQWAVENAPEGFVRIRNRWTGCYLHVEYGQIECSGIEAGWHSAMWALQNNSEGYRLIRNRWTKCNINIEPGSVVCSATQPGWHSQMWIMR